MVLIRLYEPLFLKLIPNGQKHVEKVLKAMNLFIFDPPVYFIDTFHSLDITHARRTKKTSHCINVCQQLFDENYRGEVVRKIHVSITNLTSDDHLWVIIYEALFKQASQKSRSLL